MEDNKTNPLVKLAQQLAGVQAEAKPANNREEWKSFNCFVGTTFLFQTRCTEKGVPACEAYLNGLVSKGFLTSFTAEKKEAQVLSTEDISALFA